MNTKDTERLVEALFHLTIDTGYRIPALFWGETGVGKTTMAERVAQSLGAECIPFMLGQIADAGDIIGLPHKEGDRTVWLKPEWWPDGSKPTILFLDELGREPRDARQPIFTLLREGRLHTHKLPDNCIVIAAANPATDEYDVDAIYDAAFLARFVHVAFEPTPDEWLEYAARNEVDWSIRTLVAEDTQMLGKRHVALPEDIRPSPYGWATLAKLVEAVPDDLVQEVAAGLVGTKAAASWVAIRQSPDRPVKAREVLKDYSKVKPMVDKFVKANRHDLLKVTLDDIVVIAKSWNKGVPAEQWKNLTQFLEDVPQDMAFGYLKIRFWRMHDAMKEAMCEDPSMLKHLKRIREEAGA